MVPVTPAENVMVPPLETSIIAWRNDPGPESFRLETITCPFVEKKLKNSKSS